MILRFFVLFFCVYLFAEDFITPKEYAKMLYENPRGVSCRSCHGVDGAEQILAYYIKDGKKVPFIIPSIQNISFEKFIKSLDTNKTKKSIMPSYSLTKNEVLSLYNYIQEFSKDKNEK